MIALRLRKALSGAMAAQKPAAKFQSRRPCLAKWPLGLLHAGQVQVIMKLPLARFQNAAIIECIDYQPRDHSYGRKRLAQTRAAKYSLLF